MQAETGSGSTEVQGVRLHCREWGDAAAPGPTRP